MKALRWEDVPREKLSPTLERQVVWGEKATLARFHLAKGTHIARHKHENEQYTCLLQGAMKMELEDHQLTLHTGEVLLIPSWAEHEVWVLEDSVVLDFFSPARQDWREGRHQYLQGK
jgi:quercetin dioxygenase-like cupin family protein